MTDLAIIRQDRAARFAKWRAEGVYSDLSYSDYIREGAQRFADTRLVFHSRQRPAETTVGEMDGDSERLAAAFYDLGLRCGDALAVMLPTWREATLAYLAAYKLGLTVVPIVAIYGARELGFIVRQTTAKALIVPDAWRGYDYLERVEAAGAMPDLKHLVVIGDKAPAGAVAWDELVRHEGRDYPRPSGIADDVALIIYTSGTTSDPKGVKHTHNTMLCDLNALRSEGAAVRLPVGGGEFVGPSLCVLPAGHIAGYTAMLRPVLYGSETVFMDQWIAEDGVKLIEQHKITSSSGTPVFLSSLMKAAEDTGADISSLQRFGLGATAITPENVRWTDKLGFTSARVYGMTEHTVISAGGADSFEKRAYTDGKITARNQVRILDEEDHDLPVGEAGEIASLGPRLFAGYVDERLDQDCFLPGGWFKTGDIGRMDEDGYLTITDRKKDIIIRGGENISAKEIEDILATMPGIVESAVTSMPDPVMGERVCAFVVAQAGVTVTLEDVGAHFRGLGITRQKTPERVILLDDLPRTPSGKVKKVDLRASLRTPVPRGPASSLGEFVRGPMARDPAGAAIRYDGEWTTWGELAGIIDSLEAHFDQLGLPRSAQIGCVLRNKPLPCGAMLGIVALDDCVITLNGLLPDGKLADDIRTTNPPVVVAPSDDWDRPAIVEAVRSIGAVGLSLTGDPTAPVVRVPGLENLGRNEHAPPQPGIAILMLTSGTTGKPKRVPLKASVLERQLIEAADGQHRPPASQPAGLSAPAAADVFTLMASVVHIGGVWGLFGAAVAGRPIALYDKFTVEAWRQSVEEFRPRASGAPPAVLRMILDANLPKDVFSSLVSLRAGSAAVDPAMVDEFLKRYDLPVLSNYGATEFAGGVASWSLKAFRQYWSAKRGAVGRVHHGVEARIVDPEADQVLPFGEEGLLELKGFQIGDGESWVRTSDRGVLDENRFLWIRGRADNAINRGGFKVHPDEVVAVLERHPAVREASVVGLPDRRLGQVPVAAVILRGGVAPPSDAELADWVRGHAMAYCVPVAFQVVDDLPRTPSMKVSTPDVRKLFAERQEH